ncbi:MAG TPA: glycosyl hydrolase [Opitutaceae bacterium]|nr:glycosyl hydrolase [Opitutaceae bacterium]
MNARLALILSLSLLYSAESSFASTPTTNDAPAGKLAPRPLYRDPVFDAPTDPVLCFNAEQQKWLMYYTARRANLPESEAPGVTWVHGTNIGIAESSDGGATWTYRGTAEIDYGKKEHANDYTYWAPEVIWHDGLYHMFLTFVPGIFTDWKHPREIGHLTSKDGIKWETVGKVDLRSDKVIDACVIQLADGSWRMWYKDERQPKALSYANSPDLIHWEPKGNAVSDYNGEGPKVIHWKGRYWLIADCWANGMRVWSSDDCLHWTLQEERFPGSHGDVVISGDRAWWFYFESQKTPASPAAAPKIKLENAPHSRLAEINVVELSFVDNKLLAGDPTKPTHIHLLPTREEEK